MELRKKMFFVNPNFYLHREFQDIFLKSYNPLPIIKEFFKKETLLEVVIVNESIERKLKEEGKAILDIFIIGDIDRERLANFLGQVFFERKIKYAIMSTQDFFHRIDYGDKLIHNILYEK